MKTSKYLGKITRAALLVAALSAGAAQAGGWDLKQSRKLTSALLQFRETNHVYGAFYDEKSSGNIFDGVEAILDQGLPGGPHRLLRVEFTRDEVRMRVRMSGNEEAVEVIASRSPVKSDGSRKGFAELLALSIQDVSGTQSKDGSYFSQVVLTDSAGPRGAPQGGQVEVGARNRLFTLSVFSRQLVLGAPASHILNQNGAALTVPMGKVGGFSLSARVEASYAQDSRVEFVQGRVHRTRQDTLNSMLRLEATRTFAATGISVGGGVKFVYAGASGMNQEPLRMAFLRVGKAFRDKQGQEVASVQFLGTREFGKGSANGWLASLLVSFKF